MPLYDYDCAACGRRFEVIHGVHADPPAACALCGGAPVRKAFAAPAIHFKGTGWAKKERRASPTSSSASAKDGDGPAADTGTTTGSDDAAKPDTGSTTATPSPAPAAAD